ncbi:hypothetical protein H0H87_005768 [Tephrocybe sp. NHM501043]|nr:hypothetical protein H0H87_005768 [Tephrocybe sp. NHM501043]
MEDDSEGEDQEDYIDDDGSSSLSIPNESIDFDLVYSLHSFAATVEGQANVVKGDSLFLMDDSNSYWWLVRVLKTQEVGYIPAENIETPFERLARLNKHRNVDLASATQAELNENLSASQDRLRTTLSSRAGSNQSPSPLPLGGSRGHGRNIRFGGPRFPVLRYPRAIWREEDMMETDEDDDDWVEHSDQEDAGLAEEQRENGTTVIEPDDGMDWEDRALPEVPEVQPPAASQLPAALQAGIARPETQPQKEPPAPPQQQQEPIVQAPPLRTSSSRERLQQEVQQSIDPVEATETRKLTSVMDAGGPVPELSVIRVFAGKNLQTEATFKTVLLNSLTTSGDLIKQATQRFRLSIGDEEGEYYLTVKQVEGGGFAVLKPEEKPLVVFEQLVEEAMEMPKVKRSSVGSISSVASNLSMHPAIKKLPMNDFTDDSAVKFYLNRRGDGSTEESALGHGEVDETLVADSSFGDSLESPQQRQFLTVSTNHNVTPERFTSPSFRFALQLVIYPDDLPEDMAFHPQTEAIVFKDTLREADASLPVTVSPNMRRKVFVFPKNATVAEVIEIGLERFGISDGVVDGGDEVEDKSTKMRSSTRVRYGLFVNTGSSGECAASAS